jgi:cytidylate kinase
MVAEKLYIEYLDREIGAEVAARLHLDDQEVENKENPSGNFFGRMIGAMEHTYGFEVEGVCRYDREIAESDSRYLDALKFVIRELARKRSFVIHGHGSQFILKNYPQSLHVLVVAALEVQIKRVMEKTNHRYENARREIAQHDNSRREFIKRYFNADVWDSRHYDIVVNTNQLNFESAASLIINAYLSIKGGSCKSVNKS